MVFDLIVMWFHQFFIDICNFCELGFIISMQMMYTINQEMMEYQSHADMPMHEKSNKIKII